MKDFLRFLVNPISIGVAVVHWLVFTFSMYGEEHTQPFHFIYEPILSQWVLILNFIPLLFTGFVGAAVATNMETEVMAPLLITLFVFVSLQWLFIGGLINIVVTRLRGPSPSNLEL